MAVLFRVRRASCKRPARGAAHDADFYIFVLATWPLVGAHVFLSSPFSTMIQNRVVRKYWAQEEVNNSRLGAVVLSSAMRLALFIR